MPIATEFAAALSLLTRLPLGALPLPQDGAGYSRAVWAYPVVGAAIGASGGAAWWAAWRLGLPAPLGAGWTLAVLLVLTGALHEDGVSDVADALGGRTRELRLAIMRDSRIGAFGAVGLGLTLWLRGAALAGMSPAGPGWVALALVASGALGRGAILVVFAALPSARAEGLAASLGRPPSGALAVGIVLAGLVAVAALPGRAALLVIGFAVLTAAAVALLARRQFGGYTGDVFGAASVLTECVVLSALCSGALSGATR